MLYYHQFLDPVLRFFTAIDYFWAFSISGKSIILRSYKTMVFLWKSIKANQITFLTLALKIAKNSIFHVMTVNESLIQSVPYALP